MSSPLLANAIPVSLCYDLSVRRGYRQTGAQGVIDRPSAAVALRNWMASRRLPMCEPDGTRGGWHSACESRARSIRTGAATRSWRTATAFNCGSTPATRTIFIGPAGSVTALSFLPFGGGRNFANAVADQLLVDRARENANPVRPGQLRVTTEKRVDGYVMSTVHPRGGADRIQSSRPSASSASPTPCSTASWVSSTSASTASSPSLPTPACGARWSWCAKQSPPSGSARHACIPSSTCK